MPPIIMFLVHPVVQPQSAPVDPDWLLSSTVQTAGVLVAIIGGFLVSRLVTLSAERGSIIQRRQHRDKLREIKQAEYDDVHAERLGVSIEWFTDHHKEKLVTQALEREATNAESLLDDFIPVGSSHEEMRPIAEGLIESTQAAVRDILNKFPREQPPETCRELRDSEVPVPEGSEGIYEYVAGHIARIVESSRPRRAFDFPYISASLNPRITPPIVYERQDARIERERVLEIELRTLNSEVALLDEELATFKRPEGIKGAIGVLVYLALVGIALPTILMALRPVPDNAFSRIAVVAAFISGLVILFAYFMLRVKSLRPPSKATPHPRDEGKARPNA